MGAVDQIKSEAITERSVANLTQALQGTFAQLVIQQRSSDRRQPAQHQHPRYRYDEQQRTADRHRRSGVGQRQLQQAQSSDIENVSVLKDGTAAIYGSRRQRRPAGHHQEGQAESGSDRRTHGYGRLAAARSALHARSRLAERHAAQGNFQSLGLAPALPPNRSATKARQRHVLHGRDSADGHAAELQRQRIGGANTTYMISAGYYDRESNFEAS